MVMTITSALVVAALTALAPLPPSRWPRHRSSRAARASVYMQGISGLEPDDPVFQDHLFLECAQVRYSAATQGAGIGYCSSYKPFELAGNHSRAILLLDLAPRSETDLCSLADQLTLACECVTLVPLLRGGAARWPRERLGAEAWAAAQYLNGEKKVESLAVVALGGAGSANVLGLLAEGALGAHAAVALCPSGDASGAGDAARAARELSVPLLAVCGTADDGGGGRMYEAALRDALALNGRLGADQYVASIAEGGSDFLMAPRDAGEAKAGERAIALVQSWVDRYCPEGLGSRADLRLR